MSEAAAIAEFAASLRKEFEAFGAAERLIREQYARAVAEGSAPQGARDELLERPTRRFLIDGILRGLGWNPDDPARVAEEARSQGADGARLYLDYLGVSSLTRAPVVLVEAKAYDIPAAHRPRGSDLESRDVAMLISAALAALKSGDKPRDITAEWSDWLKDLQTYVNSLRAPGQAPLKRVVITAGRWMVIFEDPIDAFVTRGVPRAAAIHCFTSLAEICDRHREIFGLLERTRLVDSLPLTMSAAEALAALSPDEITHAFRGVVVATRRSGPRRGEYPTRSVFPCLLLRSAGRHFAVADYGAGEALEEPLDGSDFPGFLEELSTRGGRFENRVLRELGRPDLRAQALNAFEGFPNRAVRHPLEDVGDPVSAPGEPSRTTTPAGRRFAVHTGEPGALPEFLVVTGEAWFYKKSEPSGDACPFHSWVEARKAAVAAREPHAGGTTTSFTQSGQDLHCAHEDLRGMRSSRCHIDVLESHLCCRACLFLEKCWAADSARMPCP